MKPDDQTQVQIAYIHGRIEAEIEGFANAIGIPKRQLTVRLGQLLLGAEGGSVLGTEDRVPRVSRKANRDKAVAEVEVVERPPRRSHVTPAWKKKMSRIQKAVWARKRAS